MLNIPCSSIVFDHYQVREIRAELLDGKGVATERVKHADLVGFTCLKAMAVAQRLKQKDAYDLIYCIEHSPGGLDAVCESLRGALAGKHGTVVEETLQILEKHFVSDGETEGHLKDGPVAVATFELDAGEPREARVLRQRQVADLVELLLGQIRQAAVLRSRKRVHEPTEP